MLYAQTRQADGEHYRNLLLAERRMDYVDPREQYQLGQELYQKYHSIAVNRDAPATATALWSEDEIQQLLLRFNLSPDIGLSVLAVEMMPRYDQYILFGQPPITDIQPLSTQLGQYRILRTSPLVATPGICCVTCD